MFAKRFCVLVIHGVELIFSQFGFAVVAELTGVTVEVDHRSFVEVLQVYDGRSHMRLQFLHSR